MDRLMHREEVINSGEHRKLDPDRVDLTPTRDAALEAAIADIFGGSVLDPAARSQIFFFIGNALNEEKEHAAALKAYQYAINANPHHVEARRAMRKIGERDLSLNDEMKMRLSEALIRCGVIAHDNIHVETSQIASGNGANTNYVAKHLIGDGAMGIIEKNYVASRSYPREVSVYKEIDSFPRGIHFKFPTIYLIDDRLDSVSVFMEQVIPSETRLDFANAAIIRAKALGEFAGLCRNLRAQFMNIPVRDHEFSRKCFDTLSDVLGGTKVLEIRNRFFSLSDARSEWIANSPGAAVRGDTQLANLLLNKDKSVTFIDNGRIHHGSVGIDLGNLLWPGAVRGLPSFTDIEKSVINIYTATSIQSGGEWCVDDVWKGYGCQILRLLYHRVLRPSLKKKLSKAEAISATKSIEHLTSVVERAMNGGTL